jgi:cob(I)alamin adenosyltransferase
MRIVDLLAQYLFLKKKSAVPPNSWMKYMHGINRLSILLFLFAMVVLAIKIWRRH